MHRPSTGLVALSGFFALGAVIAGATTVALLLPGGPLEPMWRLNPPAYVAFQGMGAWAIVLMVAVAAGCACSAWGLWIRARWGHRLAVALLVVNLVGDATNALMRGDLRTLIGLPIGIALIAYLLTLGCGASSRRRRSNKRLKLAAPGHERNYTCALSGCVLVGGVAAPAESGAAA